MRYILLLFCAAACALGQDSLSAVSPDGRLEFRFGVSQQPEPGSFLRIGYSVLEQGKEIIATSYLGFWIHNQEPILGENLGLSDSKRGHGEGYNWVLGEFLQNGSLGRRINIEVRAYNDKVAFRYIIPRSTPLDDTVIDSEETEFRFPDQPSLPAHTDLPFVVEVPGGRWVGISEVRAAGFPRLSLAREDARTLLADLGLPKTGLPIASGTTLTSSWRVIAVGATRSQVTDLLRTEALAP